VIPVALAFSVMPMGKGQAGPPVFFFLLFPIICLVMGYLMVAVGCMVYNVSYKFLGGVEYETSEAND
jgi:hypothetical protein